MISCNSIIFFYENKNDLLESTTLNHPLKKQDMLNEIHLQTYGDNNNNSLINRTYGDIHYV
jgi:hypothetical protein